MAGAGKKTFTAGETLTASDVNTYLMEQSVMVFGGTAARSSAIPTPSEGMTSYRTDTQQIESYDGAEWRGMSGLQLIKRQTIGSGVSTVVVNDVFSSTYENYKIVVADGVGSGAGANLFLSLNGSSIGYHTGLLFIDYATGLGAGAASNNTSNFPFIGTANSNTITLDCEMLSPFLTQNTRIHGPYVTVVNAGHYGGYHNVAASYTGFTFGPASGTLTGGTIYVYGYGR